jgi:hypothetical protein
LGLRHVTKALTERVKLMRRLALRRIMTVSMQKIVLARK